MTSGTMHVDEQHIDATLVRRLLASQFPQWADLPIEPVPSAGTDNAVYRLGDGMSVRMPRIHWALGQVEKEQRWLPRLAPHLPCAIPLPIAKGAPGEGYPWHWSVYPWLPGRNATMDTIPDPCQLATDLARFITALQAIDITDAPRPGLHSSGRGVPLAARDMSTRAAIAELRDLGMIDADAASAAWEEALDAQVWEAAPVWIHGDLQSGNLLAVDGRLSAVIDFGCLGVGDPACDLLVAWNLFSGKARDTYRSDLNVDDATWVRGRGWALSTAVIALPYYYDTNPTLSNISRYAIIQVLDSDA